MNEFVKRKDIEIDRSEWGLFNINTGEVRERFGVLIERSFKNLDKVHTNYNDFSQVNHVYLRGLYNSGMDNRCWSLLWFLIDYLDYRTNICFWRYSIDGKPVEIPISRKMICNRIGLSVGRVSQIFSKMIELNIIREGYYFLHGIGKTKVIFMNPDFISRRSEKPIEIVKMFDKKGVVPNKKEDND
jgi:hypothetical protein